MTHLKTHFAVCAALAGVGCAASSPAPPADPSRAWSPARSGERAGTPVAAPPLVKGTTLDRSTVVRTVLAENPSVDVARQTWRAARARAPQEGGWDDPMLSYTFAPLSIGSTEVRYGQTIQLSQRFPWPGKLGSRSEAAKESAEAARHDIEVVGLDLALEAATLCDDYTLIERALEVNREHRLLLEGILAGARSTYVTGTGSMRDPLNAEVALVTLERQRLELEAQKRIVAARLNALMHRASDAPLPPPPPPEEPSLEKPEPLDVLLARARAERPERQSAGAEIRSAEAAGRAAARDDYPDITVMGSYNSMWDRVEHQIMVGVELPIPIARGRRDGAREEAAALAARGRSAATRLDDEIASEVEQARLEVMAAIDVVELHRDRLLPLAKTQIEAARAAYEADRTTFVALIEAEDTLREAELAYHASVAELSKSRARLDRAVGMIPGLKAEAIEP